MSIRLLKLSNEKGVKDQLSSTDILSIHLGYYMINGKVTYSTGISIAFKPDYVLLTLGNEEKTCFLCHVEDYEYHGKEIFFLPSKEIFNKYTPEKYKDINNISWLVFDSIQKIPTEFINQIHSNEKITEFIKSRANNKEM